MLKVLQESGQGDTENSAFKLAAHTLWKLFLSWNDNHKLRG